MRSLYEPGPQALPDVAMGPISQAQSEQARADYEAERAEADTPPDDTPEFPQFAVRDVIIRAGLGANFVEAPHLVVDTASVGASFPARVGESG
jgi:hypothetical protein